MEIGRAFGAAKIPIFVIILLVIANPIVGLLISLIPVLNTLAAPLICGSFLLTILVIVGLFVYIGYLIKKNGMDLAEAAVVGSATGGFATLLAIILDIIVKILLKSLGLGLALTNETKNMGVGLVGMGIGAMSGAIGTIGDLLCTCPYLLIAIGLGAIFAVIGAVLAGSPSKKTN